MPLKIYLAGPDVFLPNAPEVGRRKKDLCRKFGFEGLFPLDQEEDYKDDAAKIFRANCSLMQRADVGLFNLTPFRGPSADAGTVFELSFLFARRRPIYGYASTSAIYSDRVQAVQGPLVEKDSRRWDVDGYAVEDFGLVDNLMIIGAIQEAGGSITVVEEEESLVALVAFERCLEALSAWFATHADKLGKSRSLTAGAFEIVLPSLTGSSPEEEAENSDLEKFNLKPKDIPDPIPEDQRELNHGIYSTVGVLKLLKEQGVFSNDDHSYREFLGRLLQAAKVGLAADHVKSKLAARALEQIRDEIVLRKGRTIQFRYLTKLLRWVTLGIVIGSLLVLAASQGGSGLKGYGWVLMGSMAGAWMSVAATRREIAFEDLPNFLDSDVEPAIRLLFVGLLALALALFLQLELLSISIVNAQLSKFAESAGMALLLGLIAGIGEKAVSVRLIKRASEIVTPTRS